MHTNECKCHGSLLIFDLVFQAPNVMILGLVGPLFLLSLVPSFLINPSRPLSFLLKPGV